MNLSNIEDAFMFVSEGQPYEHMAYISKENGEIYYHSEYGDFDELPEDIDDPKYVAIPHKKELGLGKNLVLKFAHKYLGQNAEKVNLIFRKKGAYSKYKNLLERLGKLDLWYKYEENAQHQSLIDWCEDNEILLDYNKKNEIGTHTAETDSTFKEDERQKYLESTEIINWHHPAILKCSNTIFSNCSSKQEYAQKAFEYVRDKIKHSWDFQKNPVTYIASEVLEHQTGYCYAKSHLLAALLRAQEIPTGFCYQRLSLEDNGPPYCLHGLNAVHLPKYGWYRVDAKGNKKGVNAQFSPPNECLAFSPVDKLEKDLPEIWSEPLPVVIEALKNYKNIKELHENLPDIQVVA